MDHIAQATVVEVTRGLLLEEEGVIGNLQLLPLKTTVHSCAEIRPKAALDNAIRKAGYHGLCQVLR